MKNLAYRCLASGLALLLAVNTPVFGRWANSCWTPAPMSACLPACCPAPAPCDPCGDPCSDPCGWSVVEASSSDCGCSGSTTSVVHEEIYAPVTPSHGVPYHGPAPQPTIADPPAPTEVYEPAPAAFGDGFRSDTPAPAVAEDRVADEPQPSDDWDAGFNSAPSAEESVVEEPAEMPAGADMPLFDEEPAAEESADDFFNDTPAEEPAEEEMPADDLFGPPADDFAPEEPEMEEPADDLFDAPADEPVQEETPADDLFGGAEEAPAEEPADDLFGGATEEEPATDDLFGSEPEEAPAAEEPADDLFGTEEAAEPAAEEPTDDFFDEPAAPAEEEMPADDLFGEESGTEEEPADDLFGSEPADAAPAEEAPAAEEDLFGGEEDAAAADLFGGEEEAEEDSAEDDLFGDFGAILGEPGGVQSGHDRTWIDNTGRHSTVGRLIAIDGGSIRLEKTDGGVATVPLGRLSQADLEFVSRQAIAMTEAREWAIAHGVPTDKNAPKQARSTDKMPLRTAQL